MKDFQGKGAIIVGGVTGIGLSSAHLLLQNKIQSVLIIDHDAAKFKDLDIDMTKKYGEKKVLYYEADISDPKQLKEAFHFAKKEINNIQIVLNNAALLAERIWEKMIDINLKGSILGTKLAVELMTDQGGVIVNTSSVAALLPHHWLPVYSSTKTALLTFTQCLAETENKNPTGIRYLLLCPGGTNTPLRHGINKYGIVQEHIPYEEIPKVLLEDQEPEDVGKQFIRMVQDAPNGAVWLINGKKTYNVHIPTFEELKKTEIN